MYIFIVPLSASELKEDNDTKVFQAVGDQAQAGFIPAALHLSFFLSFTHTIFINIKRFPKDFTIKWIKAKH